MIRALSATVPIICLSFRVNCQRLISTLEWETIIKSFNAKIHLEERFKKTTANSITRNNTEGKEP